MDVLDEIASHPRFNILLVIDLMREIQKLVTSYSLTDKNIDGHYLECPMLSYNQDTVDSCVCDVIHMKRNRALLLLDNNQLW